MAARDGKRFNRDGLPPIWETLRRIRESLRLTNGQMADLMRLTEREYLALQRRNEEPLIGSAAALTESVNLNLESLIRNDIDYASLAAHFLDDASHVPEKYIIGASSRRRTVISLLNYIEKKFGWERRSEILRRFQMTEAAFSDPDALINLRLAVDISSWLFRRYCSERILFEMGGSAVHTYRSSPIGQELGKARDLRELFELMFGQVVEKYLEKNFKWELRILHSSGCIIEGKPNFELLPLIGESYLVSRVGCLVRAGFLATIPCYLDFPPIRIEKTRCVSQGDGCCRFELDFAPAVKQRFFRSQAFSR